MNSIPNLSNGYKPIQVFRYDLKYQTIYIQAGDENGIALVVFKDGNWRFENE
jgi:hypothetical protein